MQIIVLTGAKTEVGITVAVWLLIAILKKRLNLPQSLYMIPPVLSVTPARESALAASTGAGARARPLRAGAGTVAPAELIAGQ